jgi:hypothetical protein
VSSLGLPGFACSPITSIDEEPAAGTRTSNRPSSADVANRPMNRPSVRTS